MYKIIVLAADHFIFIDVPSQAVWTANAALPPPPVAPTILPASTSKWKEVADASSILMVKPTDSVTQQRLPKVRLHKSFSFFKKNLNMYVPKNIVYGTNDNFACVE